MLSDPWIGNFSELCKTCVYFTAGGVVGPPFGSVAVGVVVRVGVGVGVGVLVFVGVYVGVVVPGAGVAEVK